MLESISQNTPPGYSNEKSFDEEVPFIDEVPTLPAVATPAVPSDTQYAVTAETVAPNQPAVDIMAIQPQVSDKSAVTNALIQSMAKPTATIPVVSADHASTVAALFTVQPVAAQRGGVQRYDLRPRPKPSTRDAFLIIVTLILLLPLAACS